MQKPLISVIIPCYNAEAFLKEAIESILNQTYKQLEIILIDDGSTDNTAQILLEYASKDERIRLLPNKSNSGLIASLNQGIQEAKGAYIARMDADDISSSERLEKQMNYLLSNPTTAVVGAAAQAIDMHSKEIANGNNPIYCESATLSFSSLFSQPLVHGSILAKSDVLQANPYDKEYLHSEDFELWNRLIDKGLEIANIPEVLYKYRINSQGVSKQHSDVQNESHNKASKYYLEKRFKLSLDMPMVEMMNNRPKAVNSYSDYRKSLKIFKDIYNQFSKQEEINSYYINQRINILNQTIKKTNSLALKFRLLYDLLLLALSHGKMGSILKKSLQLKSQN